MATDNFAVKEGGLKGKAVMEDLFPVQGPYEAGHLLAPDGPGLGIEFDEAAAAAYSFEPCHGPRYPRNDGSLTNW